MDYQFVSKMTLFNPIHPEEAYTFDPNNKELLTPYVLHVNNKNELPMVDYCCDEKRPDMHQYARLMPEHEPFIQDTLLKQSIGKPIMGFINYEKTRGLLCPIYEECLSYENDSDYVKCVKQKCKEGTKLTNYQFCRLSNMYGIPKNNFLYPDITIPDCKDRKYISQFKGDSRPILTFEEIDKLQKDYLNKKINNISIEDEIQQVKTKTNFDISLQTLLLVIFGTFLFGISYKIIKKQF
jgi:hypothetical protein